MDLALDLGPMPIDGVSVIGGLRYLRERQELCDVVLDAAGHSFLAHRAVLAAASAPFNQHFQEESSCPVHVELDVHPEAAVAMLDFLYGGASYSPSEEVNRDVLRLANQYHLPGLQELACQWLIKGLTTANVLARLEACEEFQLVSVRESILELLTSCPEALFLIAKDPVITKMPRALQDLLLRVLTILGCDA